MSAHKGQAIMTTVPIAVKLVPGLLRARGVAAGLKELTEALALGAVPGRKELGRWLLSEADLEPVMDQALVHHLCSALDPVQSSPA